MATETFLTSRRRAGRDECVWCDAQGEVRASVPLPKRGHSFAVDAAQGRAVIFGRQPGFFAKAFQLLDSDSGRLEVEHLPLPQGHHFYGHGVFAPDGDYLYATENDYEHARGVVGVYDARPGQGYKRVGEFETGGIGPHEVLMMPDGETLCVANGGMETHPDYGKSILNASTMQASLAYLDRRSGKLQALHTLSEEWRQLSIRHLALDEAGRVWAGCQYANPDGRRPPLVLRHARGQSLEPLSCPSSQLRAMRNYVGSVTANAQGNVVATSSPLGGHVLFWDAATGQLWDAVDMPDVCGVAQHGKTGFLLSSGHGVLAWYHPAERRLEEHPSEEQVYAATRIPNHQNLQFEVSWDNHMRRI